MNLNFKNLPTGSLPYDNIQLCKQMVLRLYDKIPYLPELPIIDPNDNIINRSFGNIPGIVIKDGKILLPDENSDKFTLAMLDLDRVLNTADLREYEPYGVNAPFTELYYAMLEKFKPQYTVMNFTGPFTFTNSVFNKNATLLLTDKTYRKFIIQAVSVKALWYVYKVKSISPNTVPIVMFNESMLYKFGTMKRNSDIITNDIAVSLMSKVFEKVRNAGALVGVQSFEKCNWQLVFDTDCVDYISMDAYNNPANLNILAKSVNKFLAKGGYINWGIIPVMNERAISSINIDIIYNRFINTIEGLAAAGVSMDMLYKNATVSIQGNIDVYSILFAEKALMMADKLARKIPASSAR